jgi:hypothetical protein
MGHAAVPPDKKRLSIYVGHELAQSGEDWAAQTKPGLALPPRRITDRELMYDKWHTTTQRSFVTKLSGEECP